VKVVWVVDVANSRDDVTMLLVNFKHLFGCLLGDVTEERNLQLDFVYVPQMIFYFLYTTGHHSVPNHDNSFG